MSDGDTDSPAVSSDTLRILVATDNHLGFGEKYPERQNDSYVTFDEILQIGVDQDVDFVLLGGDLFHENRPSRNCEHQCMKILKKHVFGDRPMSVELVSDPETNFAHCDADHRNVNYMDPNLNIALPIFSIHGNHDDPCGLGGYTSLDNLHTAGLINYFGRHSSLNGTFRSLMHTLSILIQVAFSDISALTSAGSGSLPSGLGSMFMVASARTI